MALTGQTWSFYAGDQAIVYIVEVDDGSGGALDLTNRIVRFALMPLDANGQPVYGEAAYWWASDDSPDPRVTIPNPTGGSNEANPHVRLTLTPSDTLGLAVAAARGWHLEASVTESDGSDRQTILTGTATFTPTGQEPA